MSIEFLEPAEETAPPRAGHHDPVAGGPPQATGSPTGPSWTAAAVRLAAPACAAVAAVLLLIACWQPVFAIDEAAGPTFRVAVRVDGWGRYRFSRGSGAGQYGPRYALLLCVAAALLLVGATAHVLGGRGRARLRSVATAVVIAAAGLTAGVVGAAALDVASRRSSLAAQVRAQQQDGGVASFSAHVSYGALLWLGLVAIAVTLAALALPLVLSSRPPAEAPPVPRPPALPVPGVLSAAAMAHADDELLDG